MPVISGSTLPLFNWRLRWARLRDACTGWRELRRSGVTRDLTSFWRPVWLAAVIFAVITLASRFKDSGDYSTREWYLTAVLGLAVLVGGYFEWKSARQEASLDKFYERLCIANECNEKLGSVERGGRSRGSCSEPDSESFGDVKFGDLQIYVYRELDNLEYVLERYRRGYIDLTLAVRGLRTFRSRLEKPVFRRELARLGDLTANAGYSRLLQLVVARMTLCLPPVAAPQARPEQKEGTSQAAADA